MELRIEDCGKLQAVAGLGDMPVLKVVRVLRCSVLETLELGDLGALQELRIERCEKLQAVAALGDLRAELKSLHVLRRCPLC